MATTELSTTRSAAMAARARHAEDVAALDRGRERLVAAEAELKRWEASDEAAIARHARRLEKQTREGASGPPAALVPTDAQAAARVTAERTAEAARRMVASLESAERDSATALKEAEEALATAALAALGEEADQQAAALEALRVQVEEAERLLGACRDVPNFRPSLAVFRALRDDLHVPISELTPAGSWDRAWHTPLDQRNAPPLDTHSFWRERLAALLNGDADPAEAAA